MPTSNAETKIFETVILRYINDADVCDMYQFGFKKTTFNWIVH